MATTLWTNLPRDLPRIKDAPTAALVHRWRIEVEAYNDCPEPQKPDSWIDAISELEDLITNRAVRTLPEAVAMLRFLLYRTKDHDPGADFYETIPQACLHFLEGLMAYPDAPAAPSPRTAKIAPLAQSDAAVASSINGEISDEIRSLVCDLEDPLINIKIHVQTVRGLLLLIEADSAINETLFAVVEQIGGHEQRATRYFNQLHDAINIKARISQVAASAAE